MVLRQCRSLFNTAEEVIEDRQKAFRLLGMSIV